MSHCECPWIALVLLTTSLASAQIPNRNHLNLAKHLDDAITDVHLTDGTETIGGASIVDAVNLLRSNAAFPVSLEMLEIERPKDFVTLAEALETLHSMLAVAPLADGDKSRLDRYEELVKTDPGSSVLVPRQRTFKLVRERITVRDFLVQVTTFDDEYEWKNYGTDERPQIVIQPRAASRLNWPVAMICNPHPVSIGRVLAGCRGEKCGPFTEALNERNISIQHMYTGPAPPDPIPHGFVDLCDKTLSARDALNRIAAASHTSWTLGGIKGTRFLSFTR
jgi:hypothetical protein